MISDASMSMQRRRRASCKARGFACDDECAGVCDAMPVGLIAAPCARPEGDVLRHQGRRATVADSRGLNNAVPMHLFVSTKAVQRAGRPKGAPVLLVIPVQAKLLSGLPGSEPVHREQRSWYQPMKIALH